jgi:hypothetical protein
MCGGQEVDSMGGRKGQQHQRRRGLYEALDRLEPALRQLDGLIALHRHRAAGEDAVEPSVFEVLAGSLELTQGWFTESYSQLRKLAAAHDAHAHPD